MTSPAEGLFHNAQQVADGLISLMISRETTLPGGNPERFSDAFFTGISLQAILRRSFWIILHAERTEGDVVFERYIGQGRLFCFLQSGELKHDEAPEFDWLAQ